MAPKRAPRRGVLQHSSVGAVPFVTDLLAILEEGDSLRSISKVILKSQGVPLGTIFTAPTIASQVNELWDNDRRNPDENAEVLMKFKAEILRAVELMMPDAAGVPVFCALYSKYITIRMNIPPPPNMATLLTNAAAEDEWIERSMARMREILNLPPDFDGVVIFQ